MVHWFPAVMGVDGGRMAGGAVAVNVAVRNEITEGMVVEDGLFLAGILGFSVTLNEGFR